MQRGRAMRSDKLYQQSINMHW